MPKAKKTVKKVTKTSSKSSAMSMPITATSPTMPNKPVRKMNTKLLSAALVVLAIALLTYKFGPWAVPALVDGHPITRIAVWNRMEKSYGSQTVDDLVNEKVLDTAIAKSGVKVDQTQVDTQMKALETQFSTTGGLDQALTQRGMTRADLEKQVRTQVAVETILADKITPTDAEIAAQYASGAATTYKGQKLDDVKASIADQLKQSKMQDAFLAWFADVKKSINVKTFGI